jgi:hypothetical protein
MQLSHFRTSETVSGLRKLGVRNERESSSSTLQTPKPKILFTLSRFGISPTGTSRTEISRCAKTRGLAPGFLRSRNSEAHIYTKLISGFHKSGFRDVRRQEVSHLGFPGVETSNPIYTLSSFWGFTSRDFEMCADKRSRTWVSRELKLRSPYIH